MQWNKLDQEPCSVSKTLSVIGDRWTLLILRDCFRKVRRFDDFQERLGIGRPVLADRLQKLVDNSVLMKAAYQDRPMRYEYRLTQKGLDLYPVIMSMNRWGDRYMPEKKGPPLLYRHVTCGHTFELVQICSECGEELDPRGVHVEAGPGARDGTPMPVVDPPLKTARQKPKQRLKRKP